ncbi:radical SAM protein [Pseudostreptobacillus hongkongensis]|uniref:radical SAM protein n=1 Tax=Pseudostreptobacillus hongkongensis TaxID=1162717 RepID=UPI0028D06689|nr:radical SAM protein [Pseudostreptobacillus hongkongensis]
MIRYSKVLEKNIREIVLLKSFPCDYSKCAFCNYILDNSNDEDEINSVNFEVLENITGEFGVLQVINSGSIFEIPKKTLERIKEIIIEKNIKILYCEAYFGYVKRLNEIREFFDIAEVRFMIGIETFDNKYRIQVLKKNFYLTDRIFKKIKEEYTNALLMICTQGQTKEQILDDIKMGLDNFKEVTISVFVDNGTAVKRDQNLVDWFVKDVYNNIKDLKNVEILIDNKDLGVYVQ